jgi:hypothetical protein
VLTPRVAEEGERLLDLPPRVRDARPGRREHLKDEAMRRDHRKAPSG